MFLHTDEFILSLTNVPILLIQGSHTEKVFYPRLQKILTDGADGEVSRVNTKNDNMHLRNFVRSGKSICSPIWRALTPI